MSVLIRGMEIPDNCTRCDYIGLNTAVGCPVMTGTDGRATDCPLIEIKTPHGRLIDADELMNESRKDEAYGYVDTKHIYDAPTVIEAEGEE